MNIVELNDLGTIERFNTYPKSQFLPLYLKVEDKNILIVGGGDAALELLLNILYDTPEVKIDIVNETIDDRIQELKEVYPHVTLHKRNYLCEDLNDKDLVFLVVEDEELVDKIASEAKERHVLVNTIHKAEISNFFIQNTDDFKDVEIQTIVGSRWRRMAWYSLAAFLFMIVGHIVFSLIPVGELSQETAYLVSTLDETFYWMILVGFLAQLIDGALGMGYGLTSTAALLGIGIPLPSISGSIHTAEMFSSGASGFSHYKFGNVNKKLLKFLIIPGVIGSVAGAVMLSVLSHDYSYIIKPFIACYTLIFGVRMFLMAMKKKRETKKVKKVGWLAFCGGFLDSFGGGGWGPVVTSTLISKGRKPRFVIGTVSLAEFFVTLSSAFTFFMFLGLSHWKVVLGLIIGGVIAAPLAAKLSGKLPIRTMLILVGILVVVWSLNVFLKALGVY